MRHGTGKVLCVLLLAVLMTCAFALTAQAEKFDYVQKGGELSIWENSSAATGIGNKFTLRAVSPDDHELELENVTYTSKNKKIAMVNAAGTVKPLKKGSVSIVATTPEGVKYTLTLKVLDPKKPTGIRFTAKKLDTYTAVSTDLKEMLEAKTYPDALDKNSVKWSSSKPDVVSVTKKGVITAQKTGSAVITAVTKNGKKASITVKVGRNKIDNLSKPKLSSISYGQEIYLKSVEIVSQKKVVCEYYLLFKRLSSMRTTRFAWIEDTIYCYPEGWSGDRVVIVDGTVKNIPVSTRGQTIKVFTVTYTGNQVKNTNVPLPKLKDLVYGSDEFWLEWVY